MTHKKYLAAGGIVKNNNKILVLVRPKHNEIRLPKGHIDEGESAQEAALREV
ncbi:MAG: NUDIX domain-containing protein, partial [Candidatus Heimdallarchaeota archaeon]|nr:NUDIX domain-containing protein [Candidatus Heimdallarchaeota archaeon]